MSTSPAAPPQEETKGLSSKGLGAGAVGLFGAVVIGISCIAPAYTFTEALGPTVEAVGVQVPAVLIVGFLPMLLVAFAYRELNSRMPDSGTTFTWATRAFGPWLGWMGGWGVVAATIIVLSNLAGVAVDFFYLALSQIFGNDHLAELSDNKWVNVATCLVFIVAATSISYRDMKTTQRVQYWLVGFQLLAMVLFGGVALYKGISGESLHHLSISWSWFNPFEISSVHALTAGLAVSVFIFWGWDVTLTMTEETKGSRSTPGKAATLTVIAIISIYMFLALGLMSFAGVGDTGDGLGNPDIQENVFFFLSEPVLGLPLAILVSLAVLSASAASLQSTFVSPARTMLAMGHYGALPKNYAKVHPRFFTPGYATIASAIFTSAFYVIMRLISENVLWDTVATLGAMVCFYYGITAFAAFWYFRKEWFTDARGVFFKFVAPLLGGASLVAVFINVTVQAWDPDSGVGSGSSLFGVGLVFILTVAIVLLGLIIMFVMAARRPEFFRGKTIPRGIAGDENEAHASLAD